MPQRSDVDVGRPGAWTSFFSSANSVLLFLALLKEPVVATICWFLSLFVVRRPFLRSQEDNEARIYELVTRIEFCEDRLKHLEDAREASATFRRGRIEALLKVYETELRSLYPFTLSSPPPPPAVADNNNSNSDNNNAAAALTSSSSTSEAALTTASNETRRRRGHRASHSSLFGLSRRRNTTTDEILEEDHEMRSGVSS